jgi:hypothetical protein
MFCFTITVGFIREAVCAAARARIASVAQMPKQTLQAEEEEDDDLFASLHNEKHSLFSSLPIGDDPGSLSTASSEPTTALAAAPASSPPAPIAALIPSEAPQPATDSTAESPVAAEPEPLIPVSGAPSALPPTVPDAAKAKRKAKAR